MTFLPEKLKKWSRFDKFKATVMDTLYSLNNLIDESDPDLNLPNIVHAFQTAERIRKEHPNEDWFHLTGLIHDLGKVKIPEISKSIVTEIISPRCRL